MLNLFLILAALTGLPALTEVGRVLMSLLVRLIGLAFAMALVMGCIFLTGIDVSRFWIKAVPSGRVPAFRCSSLVTFCD